MSDEAIRLQAAYIMALAYGFEHLAAAFGELLTREVKACEPSADITHDEQA